MQKLDESVRVSLEKAMAACKANEHKFAKEYEQPLPHDMREANPDDKRDLHNRAIAGTLGEQWRRIAEREPIGVFLWLYEHWREAPTDAQLERMWPGWTPDEKRQGGGDNG